MTPALPVLSLVISRSNVLRNYEIITIFQEGGDIQASKKTYGEILERNGVKMTSEEDWGAKNLPHLLKKQSRGFYHLAKCQMEPSSVKVLSHEMQLQQDILHFMVKSQN